MIESGDKGGLVPVEFQFLLIALSFRTFIETFDTSDCETPVTSGTTQMAGANSPDTAEPYRKRPGLQNSTNGAGADRGAFDRAV